MRRPEIARSEIQRISGDLARRQHGVVSRYQLIDAGVSDSTVDSALRHLLHPVFPGVFAVGRPQITQQGIWMAGVLCAGPGALLGYRSAAAAHGILKLTPAVEIVRARSKKNLRARIDLEGTTTTVPLVARRTRNLPDRDVTSVAGIPATTIGRTLLDLSATLDRGQLKRAFLEADRLGLLDEDELLDCASRPPGRRGASEFKRLVLQRIPEIEDLNSVLEGMFLDLCRAAGIASPEVNVFVEGCEVDCLWREEGLIVELDGYEFHRGQEKLEEDNRKSNRIRTSGWKLLRFTWRMVRFDPELVAEQVRQNLLRSAPD